MSGRQVLKQAAPSKGLISGENTITHFFKKFLIENVIWRDHVLNYGSKRRRKCQNFNKKNIFQNFVTLRADNEGHHWKLDQATFFQFLKPRICKIMDFFIIWKMMGCFWKSRVIISIEKSKLWWLWQDKVNTVDSAFIFLVILLIMAFEHGIYA